MFYIYALHNADVDKKTKTKETMKSHDTKSRRYHGIFYYFKRITLSGNLQLIIIEFYSFSKRDPLAVVHGRHIDTTTDKLLD